MGFFVLLAVEAGAVASELAETAEEGGFGLNFNLLETNLINLAIVIGLLVYLGRKFLGGILADRTATIEAAIKVAEDRRKEAAAALAEEQQKLAQAQAEAERIRAAAEEAAKAARQEILAQAEKDVQRLKETAVQDINTEQERAILELRQRVAAMALQRVEGQIAGQLNESVQQRLIDRSIATLGGR